jgi:hypothetical protein
LPLLDAIRLFMKIYKQEYAFDKAKRKIKSAVLVKELHPFMQGHKEFLGAHIGSCIIGCKWGKEAAHAHVSKYDPARGYICFRTEKDFLKETTAKHELAHIISGKGHNRKWAEAYVVLCDGRPKWLTVDWLQKKYKFR